jgi:very-short-patch-repair endonuclease
MGISFNYNGKLKPRARELRQAGNLAEILMWKQLQNRKFCDLLFHKQKTIGNFIVDFCCESARVIIEVDGGSHIGKEEHDAERQAILEGMGFHVIRVSDADVKLNMCGVLTYLQCEIERLANSPLK